MVIFNSYVKLPEGKFHGLSSFSLFQWRPLEGSTAQLRQQLGTWQTLGATPPGSVPAGAHFWEAKSLRTLGMGQFFLAKGAAKFDLFLKLRSNWIDRDLILTQTHTKISLKVWGLEHDWSRKSWRINKNWRLKECIGQLTSKNGDSTSKNGDSTSKNGDSTSKNGDSTGKRWGCNELKWVYHGLSPSTVGMQEWLVSK